MTIMPNQVRAARAMLGLSQADLAERAHTTQRNVSWIEDLEAFDEVDPAIIETIRGVLQQGGIEFIPWGVRQKPPLNIEQQELFDDLMAISKRSAALLKDGDRLTDDDLYDQHGLPA